MLPFLIPTGPFLTPDLQAIYLAVGSVRARDVPMTDTGDRLNCPRGRFKPKNV